MVALAMGLPEAVGFIAKRCACTLGADTARRGCPHLHRTLRLPHRLAASPPRRRPGTPQCFLLTPKLLPDLPFTRDVTVLQIMNGNNISDVRCAACAACCAVLCCAALSRALPASLREQSAWIGIPSPAAIHLRCCCCSHAAHLLQVATSFSMEKLLGRQRMQVLMAAAV